MTSRQPPFLYQNFFQEMLPYLTSPEDIRSIELTSPYFAERMKKYITPENAIPLFKGAVDHDSIPTIKRLLRDFEYPPEFLLEEFYRAAHDGRLQALIYLTSIVNPTEKEFTNALKKAIEGHQTDAVRYLAPNVGLINLLLEEAQSLGYNDIVRELVLSPKDPTVKLGFAVKMGLHDIIESLLKQGVDPNFGMGAPLLFAIGNQDYPSVQLLLEYGADPNITPLSLVNPYFALTRHPLVMAINAGNYHMVKLLLEHGARLPEGFDLDQVADPVIRQLLSQYA